jgi:predicted transposase/invertase (TIGR01784 family)
MPKFTKEVDKLETRFEKWMYVIKNLKRLDNIPDKLQEKVFEKIFKAAEIAKLTPEEYEAYVDSLNSYRDLQNCMDTASTEARIKEKLEIAKKLKDSGMPFEQIAEFTNLTIDEIEKL